MYLVIYTSIQPIFYSTINYWSLLLNSLPNLCFNWISYVTPSKVTTSIQFMHVSPSEFIYSNSSVMSLFRHYVTFLSCHTFIVSLYHYGNISDIFITFISYLSLFCYGSPWCITFMILAHPRNVSVWNHRIYLHKKPLVIWPFKASSIRG